MQLHKLATAIERIFRWFDSERRSAYPALAEVVKDTYYEKVIVQMIEEKLDETGAVKIRRALSCKRFA